jgi:hypothetical protein
MSYNKDGIVVSEYTQGICQDGAAILCDGVQITVDDIVERLNALAHIVAIINNSPELNPDNYSHEQVLWLNEYMCAAFSIIEDHT